MGVVLVFQRMVRKGLSARQTLSREQTERGFKPPGHAAEVGSGQKGQGSEAALWGEGEGTSWSACGARVEGEEERSRR